MIVARMIKDKSIRTIKVRLLFMKRGDECRMATTPWPSSRTSRTSLHQVGAERPAYCSLRLRAYRIDRTSFHWPSVKSRSHIVTSPNHVADSLANTSASTAHGRAIGTTLDASFVTISPLGNVFIKAVTTTLNPSTMSLGINTTMDDLSISDFSDFEEILTPDEAESIEWNPQSPAAAFAGQPPLTHRERRHPPWSGHRDRLVGIVDMGRCVMNHELPLEFSAIEEPTDKNN